jgi:hypothetical protein
LPEKKNSSHKKYKVGEPNAGGRGETSLTGERHSNQRKRIVEEDQENGQDKPAGLATLLRGEAERNADQGKDDARGRQRKAAMVFDQVPAAGDGVGGARDAEEFRKPDLTE